MFSNARKLSQQTAQRLISGHLTLIAWWTLKNAGVFDAMQKLKADSGEGLDPLVYSTRTSLAPDVLNALLEYLRTAGLVSFHESQVRLTAEGQALLDHEDALLALIRSYRPVVDVLEHLLAKLKTHGGGNVQRKTETLAESQAQRYAVELFPAIEDLVAKHKYAHLLDLNCGAGDLLIHLAKRLKNIVGVGIGADGLLTRRANDAITKTQLEKRLIAVPANPLEVCTNTRSVFDRIGISRQLWDELDCLIATNLFSESYAKDADTRSDPDGVAKILSAIPKNFPKCHLLLIEPTASPHFDKNYYAPELAFLMRLCKSSPWTSEQWHSILKQSKFKLLQETPLTIDGLTIFLCKPA